jgi:NAD(P)-dependent dehydrogenase (short-subunit alcohol dehydrogenase family)
MPYSLKGRNVLITGGSRGLGALLAEKFAAEGCNIAVNYLSSEGQAKGVSEKVEAEWEVRTVVLQGVSLGPSLVSTDDWQRWRGGGVWVLGSGVSR